jgi:hypothetical protein
VVLASTVTLAPAVAAELVAFSRAQLFNPQARLAQVLAVVVAAQVRVGGKAAMVVIRLSSA